MFDPRGKSKSSEVPNFNVVTNGEVRERAPISESSSSGLYSALLATNSRESLVLDLSRVSVKCTALVNSGLPFCSTPHFFPPKKMHTAKMCQQHHPELSPPSSRLINFQLNPSCFLHLPCDSIRTSIRRLMRFYYL